jgi:hypothetical protein
MGEAICNKCGTNFPEEANFCPSCGAKRGATTQYATQPTYGIFGMLFSKNLIIVGVCFGILLAWIGSVIFTFGTTSQDAIKAAMVLGNIGFAALGLFLLGGGIFSKEIDKYVRVGMVIMGAYVIVTTLNIMSSLMSLLSYAVTH